MRRLSVSVAALLALAACSDAVIPPSPAPPVPVPAPAPSPAPAPAPAPPASADWRDWPLTPGEWTYRREAGGSAALFGRAGTAAELTLRCERAQRRMVLARAAPAGAAPVNMNVRTSSLARTLAMQPAAPGALAATLSPRDALLDAIGFSRGRFVVEGGGQPALVVPAWAEVLRVIEDCR